MHEDLDWNGIVVEDAKEFATAAIKLYTEKSFWEKAQKNGQRIINQVYSKELLVQKLLKCILSLQNDLKQHRQQNFTGAMLMHHTISGTKYMSKWIEEKNK